MRALRPLTVLLAAGFLALGLTTGASAAPKPVKQTWYLAVTDTTDTSWAATYYKTYTVTIHGDGRISGSGKYVGTDVPTGDPGSVACYDQVISGRRNGSNSSWRADYVNEPYWFTFAGSIAPDGTHDGTGRNVNGHTFVIKSVTKTVLDAHRNC